MSEPQVELMYKAPGREEHQSLVEILDEIFNTLENITKRLEILEKQWDSMQTSPNLGPLRVQLDEKTPLTM